MCQSTRGLLQHCTHPKLSRVYIYVLICRWRAMCLADLYLHAHWSVPIWAADAGGEGRVLAHTSKQHHELLLPAYLKIATVKKSGQAQPWGREGWVEGSGGNGTEPLSSPRPEPEAPVCLRGELPEFSPGSYSQPSSLHLNRRPISCLLSTQSQGWR